MSIWYADSKEDYKKIYFGSGCIKISKRIKTDNVQK
jgi:hypothetical protein